MPVKKKKKSKKPIVLNQTVHVTCLLSGKVEAVKQLLLTKQASKYKFSSLEDYIKFYICKECVILLRQGFTETHIRDKFLCEDKTKIPFNILKLYVKVFKNREKIEKLEKRKEVQEYLEKKEGAYIVKPHITQYVDLKSASQVADLTKGACLRPDIYLNNNKACNGCHIFKLCKCSARKWNDKLEDIPIKPNKQKKKK